MIKINLLPVREARRRADLQQQLVLFGLLLGVALAGVGYAHYAQASKIDELTNRVAQTEAEIKKYEPQLKQVEAYKQKKAEVQQKLDVIEDLERSRSGPVRVMDELATKTPERMWLTRLQTEGERIELEGMSLDNEIVAVFLTRLNDSPYFGSVELEQTELQGRGELKLNRFRVTAVLTNPGDKGKDEAPENQQQADPAGKPGGAVGR